MRIGKYELTCPILQGGMGVGVSMGGLAGAVAACGGMGTISTADAGYLEADFAKNPFEANLRALRQEIGKAKEIAKGAGMVAVNAMVATVQYADAVRTAVAAGVDAVVSGAGLPLDLPELVGESGTAKAPIVSSPRAAKLILKTWDRKYHTTADFIVLEGKDAGGHLGFDEEQLKAGSCPTLEELLPGVLAEVRPYEEKYGHPISVFVAGTPEPTWPGTPSWEPRACSLPPALSPPTSAMPPRAIRTYFLRPKRAIWPLSTARWACLAVRYALPWWSGWSMAYGRLPPSAPSASRGVPLPRFPSALPTPSLRR